MFDVEGLVCNDELFTAFFYFRATRVSLESVGLSLLWFLSVGIQLTCTQLQHVALRPLMIAKLIKSIFNCRNVVHETDSLFHSSSISWTVCTKKEIRQYSALRSHL